ncbi:prostaglandin reductase 1-like [Pollicipes pollicipes]|uniref:prostaglandin reductase 1-like n=1 Tax=Pollicipes pollicipes TaxID=41117 RepID=UPI001884F3DD|nr:prostaglandin reductase 1-like [Pollicipes pollicipes]
MWARAGGAVGRAVSLSLLRSATRSEVRPLPCQPVRQMSARVWCLATRPDGPAKASDFQLKEEPLPEPKEGDVLLEAEFLSVDPYMRAFASQLPLGEPMPGAQVAKVVSSRCPTLAEGRRVLVAAGWRERSVVSPETGRPGGAPVVPLPAAAPVSYSHYLGVVGMTGLTAYCAVHDLLQPQPGQTLVVNAAAGAVGSVVGQIGRILGARVIGYAGSDDKVAWLKDTLKFDEAFNYKTQDLAETLRAAAPDGVNCYFDAVGGKFSATVVQQMADKGRIACIGASSGYNDKTAATSGPFPELAIIMKQLTITGFQYFSQDLASEKFQAARAQLAQWVAEGKLEAKQTFTDGFQNMPQALLDMMAGKNTGKMVVRA